MSNLAHEPLIIMVAPNGARRNHQDHVALPVTIDATVASALACQQEGASILHAHIRDQQGKHSLDAGIYSELLAEMASRVPNMLVQITTEAVGQYSASQQMNLVTKLCPQMASVALRELVPNSASEAGAKRFFSWAGEAQVQLQIILYDGADVARLMRLRQAGVIGIKHNCVLYVLGRYSENLLAEPKELQAFLTLENQDTGTWFACAFGQQEHACMVSAINQGGHARVGFENNLWLPTGELAPGNQTLVSQVAAYALGQGREVATAQQAGLMLGVRP
jgi:uncharacterized protein (DUF849 family)